MKITATKIKRELVDNYGWSPMAINSEENKSIINQLLTDTLKIIDNILKNQKGISIK